MSRQAQILKIEKNRKNVNLLFFLEQKGIDLEQISSLRISKDALNWIINENGVSKDSNTSYNSKSVTDKGKIYPPIKFTIERTQKGFKISKIKACGCFEKEGKTYKFPAKGNNKKNEILITV